MKAIVAFMLINTFFGIMTAVLTLAFFIIWIVLLIDLVNGEFKDKEDKIIWLIILIALPPIGAPLYNFIGKKKKIASEKMEILKSEIMWKAPEKEKARHDGKWF